MRPRILHMPDEYFRTENLIAEWDKLSFASVANPHVRNVLNEMKEVAISEIVDPKSDSQQSDDTVGYAARAFHVSTINVAIRQVQRSKAIQPHHQHLWSSTHKLYLASFHANTTREQRIKR